MPRRLSSSCRRFERLHAEYVDGFLSGEVERECLEHLAACPVCARHDVLVRRSLLALQALPDIEPSADFGKRLKERIAREGTEAPRQPRGARWGMAGAILAASVALLVGAALGGRTAGSPERARVVAHSPSAGAAPAVRAEAASTASAFPTEGLGAVLTANAGAVAVIAVAAPKKAKSPQASPARFEALPGSAPLRSGPLPMQRSTVRLQTASYLGQ